MDKRRFASRTRRAEMYAGGKRRKGRKNVLQRQADPLLSYLPPAQELQFLNA